MDPQLVIQAREGDRDAFANLVHQVSDPLFAVAHRILRDSDLASDALQETLITAWRQLPRLREADRFEAWTRRILVNACYAEVRRRKRWTMNVRVLATDDSLAPDGSTSLADRDEFERLFRRLPMAQRAVFVLHHYLGMPLVEIAETLDVPPGTVRSRLHYATRTLREAVNVDREVSASQERSA